MENTRTRVALCPGVLELRTNVVQIPDFQLFSIDTGGAFEECAMKVAYTVGPVDGLHTREKGIEVRDDRIAYKKSLGIVGDLKCAIRIGHEMSELRVNRTYHRLGRASIDTVPSVGKLLEDVISLQLLMNGYAMIHCAGLAHGNGVAVLIGLANTGKTTTALTIVKNGGAKYVAEDIAITDGEGLYCCPYALSAVDEDLVDADGDPVYQWFADKIPLLDRVYSGSVRSIYDILDRTEIRYSGEVTDVFILSRGKGRRPSTDPSRMIQLSNRAEFTYSTSHVLLGAQYLGYGIDVHEAMKTEERLIDDLVTNSDVSQFRGDPATLFDEVVQSIGNETVQQ